MKIMIVGLGLMGGSYAEGLTAKGHEVYGYDMSDLTMMEAIRLGVIHKKSNIDMIRNVDLLILALYPKDNVRFILEHKNSFPESLSITDIAGSKVWMMEEIEKVLPKGVSYTSHHPMAGRETQGFTFRNQTMFQGANFIIVKSKLSHADDFMKLETISKDLNFGKITVTDAKTHDELIAFTSQLTHILAVALMHKDHLNDVIHATGDSFRDLTRIAKINEVMWTELFLENKEHLIQTIQDFQSSLDHVKQMIETDDKASLMDYLKQAKEKRKSFDTN